MGAIYLISVILGLAVLVYLVCKDISLLVAAPIASIFVLVFSGMDMVGGIIGQYRASPMLGIATALIFCVPMATLYCYFALRRTEKKARDL